MRLGARWADPCAVAAAVRDPAGHRAGPSRALAPRMCLALFALDAHPRFALVVAANRDEFHARRGSARRVVERGMAGRPRHRGGRHVVRRHTRRALGVRHQRSRSVATRSERAVARARSCPRCSRLTAPPRGNVRPHRRGRAPPQRLQSRRGHDRGSVLGLEPRRCDAALLRPGIYGLSNAALDTPWPKVDTDQGMRSPPGARAPTRISPTSLRCSATGA